MLKVSFGMIFMWFRTYSTRQSQDHGQDQAVFDTNHTENKVRQAWLWHVYSSLAHAFLTGVPGSYLWSRSIIWQLHASYPPFLPSSVEQWKWECPSKRFVQVFFYHQWCAHCSWYEDLNLLAIKWLAYKPLFLSIVSHKGTIDNMKNFQRDSASLV